MRTQGFKLERERRNWSQREAASRLGVAQSYLSMLENAERPLGPSLARRMARLYGLTTVLPVPRELEVRTDPQTLAEQLASLGYPGFAYLRPRRWRKNPAEVLLTALAQDDLEARLAEALPWLLLKYWNMDTTWLVQQAKLRDLQNRLGFVVSLARRVAKNGTPQNARRAEVLAELETVLERSRLAQDDTLCQSSLGMAERRWLQENRPEDARRWNLLTDWRPDLVRYAN